MRTPGPVSQDYATEVISRSGPSPLTLPVPFRLDHADHIIKTALDGHTKLASDHVLHPEIKGRLTDTVGSLIERAGKALGRIDFGEQVGEKSLEKIIIMRNRIYDMLLEMVWNLTGAEKGWAGLSGEEASKAILTIMDFLKDCEKREEEELGEPVVFSSTMASQLNRMKLVNKGNSLVAWMAKEIEENLRAECLTESYVKAVEKVVKENFYYAAYEKGLCKFGNDYALGLRWLRHLGYVQVSTNPVLAALAYDDDPSLWDSFKKHVRENSRQYPEWFSEPDGHADEIAMEATRFALLDNFYVFRIPFILSKYKDGLVSYQLNPLIADDVEKSVSAAMDFAQKLENDLKVYDAYLFWGYGEPCGKGRPNLVIKVAAAYPSSIEIVRKINEVGIGQNITLSYTVSQEVILGVAAMEGMAAAMKRGITPTQTYDTNMGGRLEDHLRESVASNLLLKAIEKLGGKGGEALLEEMARRLEMKEEDMKMFKERDLRGKIDLITRKRILGGSLLNETLIETLVSTGAYGGRNQVLSILEKLEGAIKMSGTHVARRVYEIMFSPLNRSRWVEYLVRRFDIPRESAELIVARVDLLPASKRKPIDTFLTISKRNVTNTEFPNHQLAVVKEAFREDFRIEDYEDAIIRELDGDLETLMTIEDFVKAYEASPELNSLLKETGVGGDYGSRGVGIDDWPNYGPCIKTLEEFTNAYLSFRERVLNLVRGSRHP